MNRPPLRSLLRDFTAACRAIADLPYAIRDAGADIAGALRGGTVERVERTITLECSGTPFMAPQSDSQAEEAPDSTPEAEEPTEREWVGYCALAANGGTGATCADLGQCSKCAEVEAS